MTDDEFVPGTLVRRAQREVPGPGGRGTLPVTITEPITDTTEVTADQLEAMLRVLLAFAAHNADELPVALRGSISAGHIEQALAQGRLDRQALEYRVDSLTAELGQLQRSSASAFRSLSEEARTAKKLLAAVTRLHRRDDEYRDDEGCDGCLECCDEFAEDDPATPVMCSACGQLWPCATFRAAEGLPEPEPYAEVPAPPERIRAAIGWGSVFSGPAVDLDLARIMPSDGVWTDVTYTLRGRPGATLAVYRAENDDRKYLELYYVNDRWQVGEARQ